MRYQRASRHNASPDITGGHDCRKLDRNVVFSFSALKTAGNFWRPEGRCKLAARIPRFPSRLILYKLTKEELFHDIKMNAKIDFLNDSSASLFLSQLV